MDAQLKRDIVRDLSTLLTAEYVLDEVAQEMVDKINARLASGGYDEITDPKELARMLTADLREIFLDRHLAVVAPERFAELKDMFGEPETVAADRDAGPEQPHDAGPARQREGHPEKPAREHLGPEREQPATPQRERHGGGQPGGPEQHADAGHQAPQPAAARPEDASVPGRHDMRLSGEAPRNGIAVARVMNRDGRTNIGFLELVMFDGSEASLREMDRVMQSFEGIDALIIDLRASPGGDADMVKALSSYLFAERTHLVSTIRRKDASGKRPTTERWTTPVEMSEAFAEVPVHILIGSKTFSAAESFSFGLKITDRATLVGNATGGGGHMNAFFALPGGFGASISVGRTFDPATGEGWQSTGVTPDIECEEDHALFAALQSIAEHSTRTAALDPDRESVHQSLQQYANAWYQGDAVGMKEVIGDDFVERQIAGRNAGRENLNAEGIVKKTGDGAGLSHPRALRNREITVFDVYGDAASAKLMLRDSVHYVQLARANDGWKIVGDSVVKKSAH